MRDYAASLIARNFRGCMIFGVAITAAAFTCAICADAGRQTMPLVEKLRPKNAIVIDTPIGEFVVSGLGDEITRGVDKLSEQIGISNQLEQDENTARWPDAPERISHEQEAR